MNLSKSIEFFNPTKVKERVHIIGCGAAGSTIAELLARAGLSKVTLYDFDKVEPHNIANQMFKDSDIGTAAIPRCNARYWQKQSRGCKGHDGRYQP